MSNYRRRTLDHVGSSMAVSWLHSYLSEKDNRQEATMELLGCSKSSAARLSNRKNIYGSRVPLAWAHSIAAATNKPVGKLLRKGNKEYFDKAFAGWSEHDEDQIDAASDLGNEILKRALHGYNLSGTMTVGHEGGHVTGLDIYIAPSPTVQLDICDPGNYRIAIFTRRQNKGHSMMWVRLKHHSVGVVFDGRLTIDRIERILTNIYNEHKNIKTFRPG